MIFRAMDGWLYVSEAGAPSLFSKMLVDLVCTDTLVYRRHLHTVSRVGSGFLSGEESMRARIDHCRCHLAGVRLEDL